MNSYTIFETLIFLIPAILVLGGIGWRWLAPRIPDWAERRLELAGREVAAAYNFTRQRYADEKRKRSADGTLTDAEKAEAMAMTMKALREQLSLRRLGEALARIFGIGGESAAEAWLVKQVETLAARDREVRAANSNLAAGPTIPLPPPPPPPPGVAADPTAGSR